MKLKKYFKKHTITSIFLASILSFGVVYAINSVSTGFTLGNNSTKVINAHGVTKSVVNNSSNTYFVPTRTSSEWSNFRSNPPSGTSVNNHVQTYNCNSYTYAGWGACGAIPCGQGYTNTTHSQCSAYSTCWADGSHDTGNYYNCSPN